MIICADMALLQQQQLHPHVTRSRIAPARTQYSSARRCPFCRSTKLPGIREFIQSECPVRGLDGQLREQAKAATLTCSVIAVDAGGLVVPGERRLFDVPEQQLEQIIADKGQVLICCFESSDSSSSRKLAAPKKGSWGCLGSVAGLQRLPGSSRALVRVVVADRVAVQALDSSNPAVIKAQAALLRDRWAYFVRSAALEQHLQHADSSSSSSSGSDVLGAVSQVQDAAAELQQLLQQVADTTAAVVDAQQPSQLQQLLSVHEVADELQELLAWCRLQGPLDARSAADATSSSGSGMVAVAPGRDLLEKAWRLSFAPFAAKGLAIALSKSSSGSSSRSSSSSSSSSSNRPTSRCSFSEECGRAVLEMTDLGLRLEEALEAAQSMRASLAAQLALNTL